MANVDLEAVGRPKGFGDGPRPGLADFPRGAASGAMEVSVLLGRQDVELLAPVGIVAVTDEPQLFEDVERAVDG